MGIRSNDVFSRIKYDAAVFALMQHEENIIHFGETAGTCDIITSDIYFKYLFRVHVGKYELR